MNSNKKPALRLRTTDHPLVYEVNTRLLLNELSAKKGERVTLSDLPEEIIDRWEALGFDAVWLMGVWTTGQLGCEIAATVPGLQEEYKRVLPDFTMEDVLGSPYAVKSYTVSPSLGGPDALRSFRARLAKKGLGLILDYVGNHTARDHRWVSSNPELYINGEEGEENTLSDKYFLASTSEGMKTLAYGRDPLFPGWTDTAQLNYFHPDLRRKMVKCLEKIAEQCDGVRCDMAMLMLNSVFERTWGERAHAGGLATPETEFWAEAIKAVRELSPDFMFIAEAYWDMGWDLQNLGFDHTYDKRFYDRILHEGATSVIEHLAADPGFQKKSVRFIENHDERRAADVLPSPLWHSAAATVMATIPGMILFHDGQMEGRTVKVPVQLGRRTAEVPSSILEGFYRTLLECIRSDVFRTGTWSLLRPRAAWNDNQTWQSFFSFWWDGGERGIRFVVVNYSPHNGQCYIPIPINPVPSGTLEFRDLMGSAVYYREASGVVAKGMFFDLTAYGVHIFDVRRTA